MPGGPKDAPAQSGTRRSALDAPGTVTHALIVHERAEPGGVDNVAIRPSPYRRLWRWRIGLGLIAFGYGPIALFLLAATHEPSVPAMFVAITTSCIGLIHAAVGWRDGHPKVRSHRDQAAGRANRINPNTQHPFQSIDDPGLGASALGGGPGGQWGIDLVVTTDNFLRKARCGVPGCAKPATDPIHETDEPSR